MPDVKKLNYAFVEETKAGRWAVKIKEGGDEINTLEVFDEEVLARIFLDQHNERLLQQFEKANFGNKELETCMLLGREILSAGTWTSNSGVQKTYTLSDLDGMVLAFNELRKQLPPYFKLGHTSPKDHTAFAGQPAIGWIENMKRVGSKIVADFVKVPRKIADLIEAGTYRRISPEVYHNFKDEFTGKTFKHYIGAAALLGAGHGAMTSLKDVLDIFGIEDNNLISDYYKLPDWALDGGAQTAEVFAAVELIDSEGRKDMEEKDVKKLIEDAVKPVEQKHEDFAAGINESLGIEKDADPVKAISALKADNKTANNGLAERDKADFEAKLTAVIDKAKEDGKLLPANESAARLMFDSFKTQADETGRVSFAIGEKTIEGTVIECATAYFEEQPKAIELGKELGGNAKKQGGDDMFSIPADVDRNRGTDGLPMKVIGLEQAAEVEKYQREHKCDELTAFAACTGGTIPAEPSPDSGVDYSFNKQTDEMTVRG